MSPHHCQLKDLHFQIKHADRNVPEAFWVNCFEASTGPSVEICIKHVVYAHWISTVDSDVREKTGKRGSLCLKSGDNPLRALAESPQPSHSLVLLTWRCHTMGHNPGYLQAALCHSCADMGLRHSGAQGRFPTETPAQGHLCRQHAVVLSIDWQFSWHCTRGTQAPLLTKD